MIDDSLRLLVRQRAGDRCEYCHLPQRAIDGVLQVEHIIARQHQGYDESSNLALACDRCNLHKGPNLSGLDPDGQVLTRLFNPRSDHSDEHFALIGAETVGQTPVGRATVRVLQFNAHNRLQLRAMLIALGEW